MERREWRDEKRDENREKERDENRETERKRYSGGQVEKEQNWMEAVVVFCL